MLSETQLQDGIASLSGCYSETLVVYTLMSSDNEKEKHQDNISVAY